MGHEDQAAREEQAALLSDVGVVVAGEEGELDAVAVAEVGEPGGLEDGAFAVAGVVDLGHVAVDHEAVAAAPERAQALRAGG